MDINHLHLHVREMAASMRFYGENFGFLERVRHGEIVFLRNAEGFDLALVPDPSPASFPDWFHIGFRLEGPDAVRGMHTRMTSLGVPIRRPLSDEPDRVTFSCLDPDGTGIEVYWE